MKRIPNSRSLLASVLIAVAVASSGGRMTAQDGAVALPGHSLTLLNDDLAGPVELGFDGAGNIFVANEGAAGVFAWEDFVSKLGPNGETLQREFVDGLEGASGLAVDEHGNIYVSQDAGERICKYAPTGQLLLEFESHQLQFGDPNSLTLTQDGRLLAPGKDIDTGKWRILAFDIETGLRLQDFTPPFDFGFVNAVVFESGRVLIAGASAAGPILVAAEGQVPTAYSHSIPWEFGNATGLSVGSDGALFVTDSERVLRVSSGGTVTPLASGFTFARGLAVQNGCVLVADFRQGTDGAIYRVCPEGLPAWGAGYGVMWDKRVDGDELLDGTYVFDNHWWLLNLANKSTIPLPNPKTTVTWDPGIPVGISASATPQDPPISLVQTQTPPGFVWSMTTLEAQGTPGGGMQGGLNTTSPIEDTYRLGYDVSRSMAEGREVPGNAMGLPRTLTLTFKPWDDTLEYIAASLSFTDERPNPGPVTVANVSCTSPDGRFLPSPAGVVWKIGEDPDPAPTVGTPYSLTCEFLVSNSSSSPALYTPSIIVTGTRFVASDDGTGSFTYTSNQTVDPIDRLGATVTFETGHPDADISFDVIFGRSVIFTGVNAYDDHAPPTTTAIVSPAPNDGWNKGPVTVTLNATDPGGSGVKQIWYWLQTPGSPVPTPPTAVPGGTTTISDFPATQFTTVTYYAEDYAGNREPGKSVTIRIDTTAPSTTIWTQPPPRTIDGQNWWNANVVTVMLNASDPCTPSTPCSFLRRIGYRLEGAQTADLTWVDVPSAPNGSVPVSVSASGATTLTYYAEDMAGNLESPKTYVVNIDRTKPTATATVSPAPNESGWNRTTPVSVSIVATDTGGSGVKQIWYWLRYPGAPSPTPPTSLPPGDTGTINNLTATGTTVVTFYAEDNAGNLGIPINLPVRIDPVSPVIGTVTFSPGVLWPANHKMVPIVLGVTASDNFTPATALVCRVDAVTSNEPLNGTGDGNTAADFVFSGIDLSLRAERAGNLAGRVYTVGVVCRDVAGNDSQPKTVAIVVPHDQEKKK